jgi:putative hydrolases of HD superfamily
MQPMDPADKRQPNVKIAASIRAAILNGELEPGQRLPSGPELARFFGVAAMTVQRAIRTLADEGFVRTRSGSGVYVRDQASLPTPEEADHPLAGAAAFLFEMGHLKHITRAGWLLLGIAQPETVAEHSFRVGIVGITLASMAGADVGRTAALALMHDAHETRIGDVPSVGRAYVTTAVPEAVTAHQTSAMPTDAAKVIQGLTDEYEANETPEARLAHDADKIETLLQATEYQAQGHNTAAWRETSLAALRTDEGRQLAQAIGATSPQWWSSFAASYHELRAGAQDRARRLEPQGNGPTGTDRPVAEHLALELGEDDR